MNIVMNVYFVTLIQFAISSDKNRTFDDVDGILDTFITQIEEEDRSIDIDKTKPHNNSKIFYIKGPEVPYISEDNPNKRINYAEVENSAEKFTSGLPAQFRNHRKYLTYNVVDDVQNDSNETESNVSLSEEFIVEYDSSTIPTTFEANMNDKVFKNLDIKPSDQWSDDFDITKCAYPTDGPDMLDSLAQEIQEARIVLPYYPSSADDLQINEQNQGGTHDIANDMLVDITHHENDESPVYRYVTPSEKSELENKAKDILNDLVKNAVTEEISGYLNIPNRGNTPLSALHVLPVPILSYLTSTQPIQTIIHQEYPSQQISRCCTTYTKK